MAKTNVARALITEIRKRLMRSSLPCIGERLLPRLSAAAPARLTIERKLSVGQLPPATTSRVQVRAVQYRSADLRTATGTGDCCRCRLHTVRRRQIQPDSQT